MSYKAQFKERFEAGFEVQLPSSGAVVYLRPVSSEMIVYSGNVQGLLDHAAARNVFTGMSDNKVSAEDIQEIGKSTMLLHKAIVTAAMTKPSIASDDTADKDMTDDEIRFAWLDHHDVAFIVEVMEKPVRAWEQFRPE